MRVSLATALLAFSWTIAVQAQGQLSLPDSLTSDPPTTRRYQFPVNPGHQNFLAGTMGELRSTHFHAGIDIRTNNMVGMAVMTAREGYVSRAIIGSYGYGKVLFIKHPNGQTTVYAHLDKFKGVLGNHVRDVQYAKKSFDVDLTFAPNQFPVQWGDTVAYSGNTGGSSGPHLHFEIRDSANEALNPLAFGFDEIKDNFPPVAQKVALKTLDINSRINDRFGRFEFYVYKVGNNYTFSAPILAHGRIGVEVLAYDKMDLSGFKCGINHIEMYADSERVFSQVIDKINFTKTQGIVALMDYQVLKTTGARYNRLYTDDRTSLAYHEVVQDGEIRILDKDIPVTILLQDTYGNRSSVKFNLKHDPVLHEATLLEPLKKPYKTEFQENTLSLSVRSCMGRADSSITVFLKRERFEVRPAYQNVNQRAYLIDLRNGMPDSIVTCQGTIRYDNQDVIPSGTDYKYYSDWADIKFEKETLYDTVYWALSRTENNNQEMFSIGDHTIPLRKSIDVTLKPQKQYNADKKTSVYRVNGSATYLGGEWKNGRIRFQTQELGYFSILRDTLSPSIRRLSLNSSYARFRVRDNLSGIAYFEASVDGEWLLMNYDYKTGILLSERRDNSKPLKGTFKLRVVDLAGNEQLFTQTIF